MLPRDPEERAVADSNAPVGQNLRELI